MESSQTLECDVLVVGGGPAGLSAAWSAAKAGKQVVCIERKRDFGIDVRCAEGIGSFLIPLLPFEIPSQFMKWAINGINFHSPTRQVQRAGDYWAGFSLERSEFEGWLAEQARAAGAKMIPNVELLSAQFIGTKFESGVININGQKTGIRPYSVIASDGAHSRIRNSSPMPKPSASAFASVLSYEYDGMDLMEPHFEQIFFGPFAPNGYAYIFPKSATSANVGIGICGIDVPPSSLSRYLNMFINSTSVRSQIKSATLVKEKSGNPLVDGRFVKSAQCGNTFFAGDSVAQNFKPFVEGILPGVICGDIAGRCASSTIKGETTDYDLNLQKSLGELFVESDKVNRELYAIFEAPVPLKYERLFELGARITP